VNAQVKVRLPSGRIIDVIVRDLGVD